SRLNSRIEFVLGDVYQGDTLKRLGTSNVVFCSGVLYHVPDPFSLLAKLRAISDGVLILGTQIIPEMPGLRNAAVFYPMLDQAYRNQFRLGIGMQKAIT